jgi:hypothetical protein
VVGVALLCDGILDGDKSPGEDVVPVDDIVRYLVRTCDIDPNRKTREHDFTEQGFAAGHGLAHVAYALLHNGADLYSVDSCCKSNGSPTS